MAKKGSGGQQGGPGGSGRQAAMGGAGGEESGRGEGRGRGRGRGERQGRGGNDRAPRDERRMQETVVRITRNAKVVKGGRRFSFSAMVVVGDGKGKVGIGHGKATEVPVAVEKGVKDASKALFRVPIVNGGTIPHETTGNYGASRVFLRPAAPGTGVIAGAAVKAVLVAAGYENILTKTYGSTNPTNILKAARLALTSLRTREEVASVRSVELEPYAWPKIPEAKATA